MIRGEKINLRVTQEKDLETLFELWSDIENRGNFFPIFLPSEPQFKKEFQETGFWDKETGRLVITDKDDRILGGIWYYKSVPYFDALAKPVDATCHPERSEGSRRETRRFFPSLRMTGSERANHATAACCPAVAVLYTIPTTIVGTATDEKASSDLPRSVKRN